MISSQHKNVSVILPNYNYSKYISNRIDGILAQTYPIAELIILDDASTDNSVEIIRQKLREVKKNYPKLPIEVLINRNNSGNVFAQWQKGIKLATSEYIWIAEMDDAAKPSFLKAAMSGFESNNVVLSYTNSKYIGENGLPVLKDTLRKVKDVFRRNHAPGSYVVDGKTELNKNLAIYNPIPNVSAVVFKKIKNIDSILEESKKYQLMGDWLFYIELAKSGGVAYSNRPLNLHRIHPSSVTGSLDLRTRFREMCRIHKYVLSDVSGETVVRINRLEKKLRRKWCR